MIRLRRVDLLEMEDAINHWKVRDGLRPIKNSDSSKKAFENTEVYNTQGTKP